MVFVHFRDADLFGRGYSDAPNMAYDAGLYTTQLALLMQYVRWENAHIVGFSMVRSYTYYDPLNWRSVLAGNNKSTSYANKDNLSFFFFMHLLGTRTGRLVLVNVNVNVDCATFVHGIAGWWHRGVVCGKLPAPDHRQSSAHC